MKCSLGISNFLEDISSLSHSFIFLYFFELITEEGFLISSCYSLELCIRCLYHSFSPLLFASLLFTAICKASPDNHFAFLHFFSMGMVLIPVPCTMSWYSFLLMKVKVESEKNWLKAQHSENEEHSIQSHHFVGNKWENSGNSVRLYFGGLQNHCRWWLQPWN